MSIRGLEIFDCSYKLFNYFRCSQSSTFFDKGFFCGHSDNCRCQGRPILKVPISTCCHSTWQNVSDSSTSFKPSFHTNRQLFWSKQNIFLTFDKQRKVLEVEFMLELNDVSFLFCYFFDNGLNFQVECFFYHLKLLFVWCYDSFESFQLFKKLRMLAKIINCICIKNYDALWRKASDKFREEFVHVFVSS